MELKKVVENLRATGKDSAYIEVKSTTDGVGKSLWDSISAFSNTRGGQIILGLDEKDGFTTSPKFSGEKVISQIKAGIRGKDAKISPEPIVSELDVVPFEGNEVVVFHVAELPAESKPCFVIAQGKVNGSYERLSDGEHRLGAHALYLLDNQATASKEDQKPVEEATIHDLDQLMLRKLLERVKQRRPRALDGTSSEIEMLQRLQVVATGSEHPTLAGLLALGKYPQQFFSQLMISFAHYPGTSKSDLTNGTGFTDVSVLEGSIPDMVDDVVAAVLRNLKHRRVIVGAGAEEHPEIPVEAIREAVVNAVTHRDYSPFAQGDQVRVELFSDRLEIHSPGGLWGRRLETINNGISRSRNQVLAKLLTDVEFRNRQESVCENQGSGVPRMQGVMKQDGLPLPEFRGTISEFTVSLSRHGILNPEMREWLNRLPGRRSNLEEQTLALLRHLGPTSIDHLRRQLGVDTSEELAVLKNLQRQKLVTYSTALDEYELSKLPNRALSDVEEQVLNSLDEYEPMKLAAIALQTGRSVGALRPVMRAMVEEGLVIATAPPSSRNRAYLRSKGD